MFHPKGSDDEPDENISGTTSSRHHEIPDLIQVHEPGNDIIGFWQWSNTYHHPFEGQYQGYDWDVRL